MPKDSKKNNSLTDSSSQPAEVLPNKNSAATGVTTARSVVKIDIGPFPTPEAMEKYEKNYSGASEIIFAHVQNVESNYHGREMKKIERDTKKIEVESEAIEMQSKALDVASAQIASNDRSVRWNSLVSAFPFILSGLLAYLGYPVLSGISIFSIFAWVVIEKIIEHLRGNAKNGNGNSSSDS